MEKLFAYGTLRDPAIQKMVIGRTLPGVLDALSKHRVTLACSESKLFLDIAEADETVYGEVFDVSLDELKHFDVYEGENYIRYEVVLESGITAWVYDNVTV